MENENKPYKRRVRYSGKYPKKFSEKYKELQPDKYSDTIEHVIKKGSTPAGMHISIMVNEIINFLDIKPGQIGLDATLGYGGHTLEMLKKLEMEGHIYGLDIDPIELPKTKERLLKLGYDEKIITIVETNFSDIDIVALESGPLDFVLADLGVSSMQIDNPDRGFSYKKDGPLDLRMNPEKGVPASSRLLSLSRAELEGLLIENSDEPFAKEISLEVMKELSKGNTFDTTKKLRNTIEQALSNVASYEREITVKKACARTFQALRIDVNQEFEAIYEFLEKLPDVLAPGGKVAVLSFHSGEDRLVKKSFKHLFNTGVYKEISKDVIRPTDVESQLNRRARSTKMRWAIKA